MNPILSAILKALLVTLISTAAGIAIEKIRIYEKEDDGYYQPGHDEYDELW